MKDVKLIAALEEFRKAYDKLNEVLENSVNADVIAGPHYPFNESFDEIPITEWVNESIEKLT